MGRILVIKLGALGDFAQAFAGFSVIRKAHLHDEITLLTTPAYATFARLSGLFDWVETDGRPKGFLAHFDLFRRLREARYDRVYDLQNSGRTRNYFYAFLPFPPQWSGISPGASHRQTRPDRTRLHNFDKLADQLHVAGVGPAYEPGQAPAADLSWAPSVARGDFATVAAKFGVKPPFAILVPGASAVKPEKKWPVESYARLASALRSVGLTVVVIGSFEEHALGAEIAAAAPGAVDLMGATSIVELAGLGAEAALTVGNDTGPTHIAAYAGSPGLMLMSRVSDPAHCAPRGRMDVLRRDDLASLSVDEVLTALEPVLAKAAGRLV